MQKLLKAIIKNGLLMTIIRNIDKAIRILTIRLLRHFIKVDEKKIIFLNFTGNYDCNPKYICQRVIDEGIDAHLVWGINKKTRKGPLFFPVEVHTERRGTYEFYRELCSAKIIVDNGISTVFLHYPKKRNQVLVETWHGSLGIKKFGRDSNNDKKWLRRAAKTGKMTDYIISNSDFEDDIYREDFWTDTPIWKFGHPRNDILFCKDEEKIREINAKIRERYEIPENAKICMYAPTFRDDGDLSPYTIDYDRLLNALKTRFGGEWVIATRFHSRTKKFLSGYKLPDTVYNVSGYPDIQELQLIIDVGITDYSSWICEYMLRRKPGFMFATDIADYAGVERTLFFPLTALPFPVSSNEDELENVILNFDNDKFVEDCNNFLKDKGSVDDGHAAERVVNEFKKILN